MKMEREEFRIQKMVGNTQKEYSAQNQRELSTRMRVILLWFVILPQRKVRCKTSAEIDLQGNVSFSCNACFCLQLQKSQFL